MNNTDQADSLSFGTDIKLQRTVQPVRLRRWSDI